MREFTSAYAAVLGREPAFTSWGGFADQEVRGVFDYILCRGRFSPSRALATPTRAEVLAFAERLPNAAYPSDHLPLVAELLLSGGGAAEAAAEGRRRLTGRLRRLGRWWRGNLLS